MAVPKKKTSRSRRNMRRSHIKARAFFSVVCNNCGDLKIRHRVCPHCGYYRGRQIITINDN